MAYVYILRQIYYGGYITADILGQMYYGRYIMAEILREIYHGTYIMADIIQQIYYICRSRYIRADILQQVHYGRDMMADIYNSRHISADRLRQIHYGRYIAYHKNGHISTNAQRQKLSIAASESVCCNASLQRAQGHPIQPRGPPQGAPR